MIKMELVNVLLHLNSVMHSMNRNRPDDDNHVWSCLDFLALWAGGMFFPPKYTYRSDLVIIIWNDWDRKTKDWGEENCSFPRAPKMHNL